MHLFGGGVTSGRVERGKGLARVVKRSLGEDGPSEELVLGNLEGIPGQKALLQKHKAHGPFKENVRGQRETRKKRG